jgi:hypothetical protein
MKKDKSYPCVTLKVKTTDGTMFIVFVEDGNGVCKKIDVQIGKTGTQVRAWTESLMTTANIALANGVSLSQLAIELSNITTDRVTMTGEEQSKIRSGPAGFVYAINKYLRYKKNDNRKLPFEMPWA